MATNSKKIKGISVEISADVSKIKSSLKTINSDSNRLNRELNEVNRQLKFNPNNIELTSQKQAILKEQINKTVEKLKLLKEEQEKVAEAYKKGDIGEESYRKVNREVVKTENEIIRLTSQIDKLNSQNLNDVHKMFENLSNVTTKIGKNLTKYVTLPLAGASAGILKFAFDFEESMAKVGTIADTNVISLDSLGNQILDLSDKMGVSSSDLANATYDALSAGVQTADVMNVLEVATKSAKGGFTETQTAVNGLTNVLNSYNLEMSESNNVANQFLITQNLGKTTFGELASSIGKVSPIAATLKVKTTELLSSIASLTANGIATAESITGLKAAFSNIIKPTTDAVKISKKLGLQFDSNAVATKGWAGFLADVKNKTNGNVDVMSKLFGSTEAVNTILSLTSEKGMKTFNDSMTQMSQNTTALDDAFNKMNNTTKNKLQKTMESTKNKLTSLGKSSLGMINILIDKVSNLMNGFNSLDDSSKKAIMTITLGGIAIGPLVSGVGSLLTLITRIQQMSLSTGIGILVGAVGLLTTGILAVKNATQESIVDLNDKFESTESVVKNVDDKITDLEENSKTSFDKISANFLNTLSDIQRNIDESQISQKWEELLSEWENVLGVHQQEVKNKYAMIQQAILNDTSLTEEQRVEKLKNYNEKEKEELNKLQVSYDTALKGLYEIVGQNGENLKQLSSEDAAKISVLYKNLTNELGNLGNNFDPTNASLTLSTKTQQIIDSINQTIQKGKEPSKKQINSLKESIRNDLQGTIDSINQEIESKRIMFNFGEITESEYNTNVEELTKIKNSIITDANDVINGLSTELPKIIKISKGQMNPILGYTEYGDEEKKKVKAQAKEYVNGYANEIKTKLNEIVSISKNDWHKYASDSASGAKKGMDDANLKGKACKVGEDAVAGFKKGSPNSKYFDFGYKNATSYNTGFKKGLDSHSPSKLQEKIGKDAFLGYKKGTPNSLYSILGKTNAESYTKSFKGIVSSYKFSKNTTTNPKTVSDNSKVINNVYNTNEFHVRADKFDEEYINKISDVVNENLGKRM